jgi:hypothetical protein
MVLIKAALQAVLEVCQRPLGGGQLDHLWIYIDDPQLGPD